jgi:NitT/TauT family transport system permease protein
MSRRRTDLAVTGANRAPEQPRPDVRGSMDEEEPASLADRRHAWLTGRLATLALRTLVIAALIGLWQLASTLRWVDPFFISSPEKVVTRLWSWLQTASFYSDAWTTLREALIGFLVGAAAGVLIGFALGYSRLLTRVFLPILNLLNTLPRVALAPMFILWFGIGPDSKIVLVFTVVVVILIFNTYSGVQTLDADVLTNAKLLGASWWDILWKITFPWCTPWIFAGLRIALAWSVGAAVIGEYLASESGLGYRIFEYSGVLDQTGVLAGCVALLIISGVMFAILDGLEHYLLRWRPEKR